MLYGLTIHQAYRYYKLYPDDGWLYPKGIVTILLYVLRLRKPCLYCQLICNNPPKGFRNVTYDYVDVYRVSLLGNGGIQPPWHSELPLDHIVHFPRNIILRFHMPGVSRTNARPRSSLVLMRFFRCLYASFYTCRVWGFGRTSLRWFLIPAIASMLAGLAFAFVASAKAFLIVKKVTDLDKISWMVSVAYGCSVASDIMLAAILIVVFLRSRSEIKANRTTASVFSTLIIYTINTGLLTSIVSFIAFLFGLLLRGNLIYAGVSIVGAKLYANSVLALLNSRKDLRGRLDNDSGSVNLGGTPSSSNTPRPAGRAARRGRQDSQVVSSIRWASQGVSPVQKRICQCRRSSDTELNALIELGGSVADVDDEWDELRVPFDHR
ncbi:hypothetical protein C8Q73DRAFT_719614 [Cubamyces lactineus]|nr:hypothetical protein C8Q73DRAFT_719614 [Cubamyces lactineus]